MYGESKKMGEVRSKAVTNVRICCTQFQFMSLVYTVPVSVTGVVAQVLNYVAGVSRLMNVMGFIASRWLRLEKGVIERNKEIERWNSGKRI